MRNFLIFITIPCFMVACGGIQERKIITAKEDYIRYLHPTAAGYVSLTNYEDEVNFWSEKARIQPEGFIYLQKLAALKAQQFGHTGEIKALYASDSLLLLANSLVVGKMKVPNYLSLSSNAIKKHQFKEALHYCHKATELTQEKFGPLMMMFDAYMELGEYKIAGSILERNKKLDDFNYLVRLSKYQDHLGQMDSAIAVMEKACGMVKDRKSERACWALTNLADMYGHAGRLKDAYQSYLKVLEAQPGYIYALRGIAGIAYSHDRKYAEAKEIFSYIKDQTQLPDMYLQLAKVESYEGHAEAKDQYLNFFIQKATDSKYLAMYNKYLILLWCEEFKEYDKALDRARQEVNNRPTPMVYDLLAWVYEQKGEHQKALQIEMDHVEGKTFEPEAAYHLGMIYAANGQREKALEYLQKAHKASFELGPAIDDQINQTLDTLRLF